MHKRWLILIAILILTNLGMAEVLDLKTRQLVEELNQSNWKQADLASNAATVPGALKPFSVQRDAESGLVVTAFLKTETGIFNETELAAHQIRLNGKFDNIYSVEIPLSRISQLNQIEGIKWVELSRKGHLRLDVSRHEIAADRVHQQVTEVGKSFTGNGVIIGIIDSGIDFQHPDFQNVDGSSRILYLWDQTGSGSSPADFDYGAEWTTAQINSRQSNHEDTQGHGTHVTGIAAGNGRGYSDKRYSGIAPAADLIVVATSSWTTDISDGIQYIFQKAQQLNRPAVINLSIGSQEGPHDGTSLFDAAVDNLVGKGKIIVGAAGNEGTKYIHFNQTVSNDSVFTCFARSSDGLDQYYFIDLWGKTGANLKVAAMAVDPNNKSIRFYAATDKRNLRKYFIVNSDTVATLWLGYETSQLNNHQHYNFLFDFKSEINHYDWYIRVSGNGTFNAWTENNPTGIHFKPTPPASFPYNSRLYVGGNNNSSVGEIGGTAQKIISVGAYNSKNSWTNYQNYTYQLTPAPSLGSLAAFSSLGPTRDGRLKPDLTAPGNIIAAALSRSSDPGNFSEARIVHLPAAPNYDGGYVCMEGTSMSAPHVTGTVALMLEANANLAPEDVRVLLQRNARSDQFTGSVPNNSWGAGKVDTYYAVKNAATYTAVNSTPNSIAPRLFHLLGNFPNPFNATTIIQFELKETSTVKLNIYDCLGRQVTEGFEEVVTAGKHFYRFSAKDLPSGIYFYQFVVNSRFEKNTKNGTRQMKISKFFSIGLLAFFILPGCASQNRYGHSDLTQFYQEADLSTEQMYQRLLEKNQPNQIVSLFIQCTECTPAHQDSLKALGVQINAVNKNLLTARVPVLEIPTVANLSFVKKIENARAGKPK